MCAKCQHFKVRSVNKYGKIPLLVEEERWRHLTWSTSSWSDHGMLISDKEKALTKETLFICCLCASRSIFSQFILYLKCPLHQVFYCIIFEIDHYQVVLNVYGYNLDDLRLQRKLSFCLVLTTLYVPFIVIFDTLSLHRWKYWWC